MRRRGWVGIVSMLDIRERLVRWIGSLQRGSYTSETARSAFWAPLFGDGVEDSNVVCLLFSTCQNTRFKTLNR